MNGQHLLEGRMKTDPHLLLLLRLIYAGADVLTLQERGLEFSQIAILMKDALDQNLVFEEENIIRLTEQGLTMIKADGPNNKYRKDGGWISPLEEHRIEKLSPSSVYLPSWETYVSLLGKDH